MNNFFSSPIQRLKSVARFGISGIRRRPLAALSLIGLGLAGCAVFSFFVVALVLTITVKHCFGSPNWQCQFRASVTPKLDPPASELANFDASYASLIISLPAGSVPATSGTAAVTILDEGNGQTLGTNTFGYTVSNGVVTFSDPSVVTSWVRSFSSYQGNVEIDASVPLDFTSSNGGTVTETLLYNGSAYASTSGSYTLPGCGNVAQGCKQF